MRPEMSYHPEDVRKCLMHAMATSNNKLLVIGSDPCCGTFVSIMTRSSQTGLQL